MEILSEETIDNYLYLYACSSGIYKETYATQNTDNFLVDSQSALTIFINIKQSSFSKSDI